MSLVLSAALSGFGHYLDRIFPGLHAMVQGLHLLLSLAITTLLFAMMFKILPDARVAWDDVWHGAAATALLFTIGKYLIGLYIGSTHVASAYGAAGALVTISRWIYYSAQDRAVRGGVCQGVRRPPAARLGIAEFDAVGGRRRQRKGWPNQASDSLLAPEQLDSLEGLIKQRLRLDIASVRGMNPRQWFPISR